MFYAILGIVVIVALFLIFRDDHDSSYNRNEKKAQRQSEGARRQSSYSKKETSQPKAGTKSGGSQDGTGHKAEFEGEAKKVIGMIGSIIEEVKKEAAEPLQEIHKGVQDQPEAEEDWEDEEEIDLSFLDNIDYSDDLEENTETFDITGLRYHCTVHDCGKIVGIVRPEPSNVHDPRAQAVYRNDGKLLGYIPRTQLDWYEDFNEQNVPCPFVGEIELDRSTARLVAEIKVIIPTSQEFVEEEIEAGL